ncbi:MAG: DUF4325 domain-containing protein [Spirochaetes bacterium]|nr:DUF4325 domain-containing protein [Spirochaetota bacterium]
MIIDIVKTAKEMKVNLPDLITRPVGRVMYAVTAEKLGIITISETVILNFNGIKVMDSSFIDEYLVKLIIDSRINDFYIKLKNISNISEINIDSVFTSYSNYNKSRIAVAREEIGSNSRFYIGSITEQERDIINYLRTNSSVSIDDMSRFTGVEVNELKLILEQLSFLRLVKRYNGEFTAV